MRLSRKLKLTWFGYENAPGNHLLQRIAYWTPRWRFAILRVLERVLVGAEIGFHSPTYWDPDVEQHTAKIRSKVEFVKDRITPGKSFKVTTLDGVSRLRQETYIDQSRNFYLLSDVVFDPATGTPWIAGGDVLGEVSQFGVDPRWSDVAHQWLRKVQTVQINGVLAVAPNFSNYFHFLIEEMPRFLNTMERTSGKIRPLIPEGTPDWVRSALAESSIDYTVVERRPILAKYYAVTGKTLISPSVEDWQILRRHFGWNAVPPVRGGGDKIFIPRIGLARSMPWEEKVAAILSSQGWQVVNPALLSLREQRDLFSTASHVAGISGAAFANVLWMQPGSRLTSLSSSTPQHGFIWDRLCSLSDVSFVAAPTSHISKAESIADFLLS